MICVIRQGVCSGSLQMIQNWEAYLIYQVGILMYREGPKQAVEVGPHYVMRFSEKDY